MSPKIKELSSMLAEMPREKLLKRGAGALTDVELLAIFLRTGVAGKSVLVLASELLQHFGGVQQVLACSVQQFSAIKGLGVAKYTQLQATRELVKRACNEGMNHNHSFTDPALVERYLLDQFEHADHERFALILLNTKHQLIRMEYLFNGSISSAQVYPRTVAQCCLKHNAAAVILVHNHPSGDLKPSDSDCQLTQQLITALRLIDVRVIDHFVINRQAAFSMASHHMM